MLAYRAVIVLVLVLGLALARRLYVQWRAGLHDERRAHPSIPRALLDGTIDLAVHSCKDLPTAPVEGLVIAAVPERESTADVLVSKKADRIESLPISTRVGTGSLRRKSQLGE